MNVVVAQLNHARRERLCSALRARGMQVFSVPDIAGAVESATQARLAVVLIDPKLLVREQEDVQAQMQRKAGYRPIVVALTNVTADELRSSLQKHGAKLLPRSPDDTPGVAEWVMDLADRQSQVSSDGEVQPGRHWTKDAEAAPGPGTGATLGHDGPGPVVLVVEDEPTFRGFLCEALGDKGYQVWGSENGVDALRFLEGHRVDLVISDVNMPYMDGFELKQKVDLWKKSPVPFIMMTADSSGERAEDAASVGVVFILAKPIRNLDALYTIVSEALRKSGIAPRA